LSDPQNTGEQLEVSGKEPMEVEYASPCPYYSPIQGCSAKLKSVTHNLMSDFVDMRAKGFGIVRTLEELLIDSFDSEAASIVNVSLPISF